MRNVLAVMVGVLWAIQAAFAAETPVYNLRLQGNANGAAQKFTNLSEVVATTSTVVSARFVDGTNVSTMTQGDVASFQGTAPESELRLLYSKNPSNASPDSAVTTKGVLGSTTAGSEGIRWIGALGGYTLEEFIEDTATRGVARDFPIFSYTTTNLTISYTGGDVYEPILGYFHLAPGTNTLVDNAVNYAYWSTNDTVLVQWTTGSRPVAEGNIYLATIVTAFGKIVHVGTAIGVGDELLSEDVAFANVMPSIITEGLQVFPTGTNLNDIIIDTGVEYHNLADRIVHATYDFSTTSNLVYYGHTASEWSENTTNRFPIGKWDNGTNIVACNTSKWYRGVFVSIANSGQLTWIMPDYEYTNAASAEAGSDPDLPSGFAPYIPLTTAYIFSGADTMLRDDLTYWLDRRFMIRRGAIMTGGGGGGGATPTLQQVLNEGSGTGGILPDGMGYPVTDDQAASKGYVDFTRNKASTGTAYVDPVNGDDITGRIEKGSLPFKTIQAAINACAVAASDTRRFLVTASIGTYTEDVTMLPYISLRGMDIESTIINGTVTWPSTFNDITGCELQVLTVTASNAPALVIDMADDDAYMGVRSCALYSMWDNDAAVKSVVKIQRGNPEIYGTTWMELDLYPTNGSGSIREATIYYGATDGANSGAYFLNSYSSSHMIRCTDSNDTISVMYSDATTDSFMASKGDSTLAHMESMTSNSNKFKLSYNKGSAARTFLDGSVCDLRLSTNNLCDVILAAAEGDAASENAVAHFRGGRVIAPNLAVGRAYYGSAVTTNDVVEVLNSQVGVFSDAYPQRYTADGSAGEVAFVIQHDGGDLLLGGGLDLAASSGRTPDVGHTKIYADVTAGFENPYFQDSTGAKYRIGRDLIFTARNSETNTLQQGELVYIWTNTATTAHYVKRAFANSLDTLPAVGMVCNVGGIAAGSNGRFVKFGRTEFAFNTSMFGPGTKLYVPERGPYSFPTNVAPSGTNFSQLIGWVNRSGVANGTFTLHMYSPDALGDQPPSYYAAQSGLDAEVAARTSGDTNLQAQVNAETNRAQVAESNLQGQINSIAAATVDPSLVQGRLTIASDQSPVPTTDQTSQTTLYFVPYNGNGISLYSGTGSVWTLYAFTSTSVSLSALTLGKNYDVFAYRDGTVKIEVLAWSTDSARATALTTQNGVYVKSGATGRKYLGTIRINSGSATCDDSTVRRFVWNYYGRKAAALSKTTATASWTYATATWRQANADAANKFEFVCGLQEESVEAWGLRRF